MYFFLLLHVLNNADEGLSTIKCSTESELNGSATLFTEPLSIGTTITCSGVYALTASDVDNLKRESLTTLVATDKYFFQVAREESEVVSLEQVTKQRGSTLFTC